MPVIVRTGQAAGVDPPEVPPGTVQEGQVCTVTGSGFGTKGGLSVPVFERFDGGVLPTSLTWSGPTANPVYNDTACPRPRRTYAVRADWKTNTTLGAFFSCHGAGYASKWFIQYWFRPDDNWVYGNWSPTTSPANLKFLRLLPPRSPLWSGTYCNVGQVGHTGTRGSSTRYTEANPVTIDGVSYPSSTHYDYWTTRLENLVTAGSWHCIQWEYGGSSAVDQPDGHSRLWIDGRLRDTADDWITDYTPYGRSDKQVHVIGFYDSSGGPAAADVDHMYGWYADVYIDSTWARVELGDHPSDYDLCTHRETQVLTAWADGAITFTANVGGFATGERLYVWVTSASGVRQAVQTYTVAA